MKRLHTLAAYLCLTLLSAVILVAALRGRPGVPTSADMLDNTWRDEGPFELSPERGRFALTYSVIEDKSVHFSIPVARFATPDVAQSNGKFVSLFAPTLSYLLIPGYLLGKMWGASQVGVYAVISLFAVFNVVLITALVHHLTKKWLPGAVAGWLFVFGSPAFAYGVSLYQHHVSTFVILISLYLLLRFKTWWSLSLIWFMCALSISLDNPNLFMMFPIGLAGLFQMLQTKVTAKTISYSFKIGWLLTFVTMIIPIGLFMKFNQMAYGDPLKLGGTADSAIVISQTGQVDVSELTKQKLASAAATTDKSALNFFHTRYMPNGFYTHLISPDRGIIYYAPVLLLGLIGFWILNQTHPAFNRTLLAITGINLLMYTMWGDPYGGWAFGSRYLIPGYALLAILLGVALARFYRNLFFMLALIGLSWYSTSVNTFGALTSNRNPPKVEILTLEELTGKPEKYTFARNMQILDANHSKSLVYATIAKNYLTAWEYTIVMIATINLVNMLGLTVLFITPDKKSTS